MKTPIRVQFLSAYIPWYMLQYIPLSSVEISNLEPTPWIRCPDGYEEMGHKQPPTPIQTDNTTAFDFVNKIMVPKATKSTDMKYWWMRDRSDLKISAIIGEK